MDVITINQLVKVHNAFKAVRESPLSIRSASLWNREISSGLWDPAAAAKPLC
ncbi:hypothetical protein [Paenibacillus sp. FSL H3-0469]|uniref:hypothetical protein n=1 Tax=Paenibacillus sp. FSL H3-0469 TaxID=2954506 RepID=UPI003100F735